MLGIDRHERSRVPGRRRELRTDDERVRRDVQLVDAESAGERGRRLAALRLDDRRGTGNRENVRVVLARQFDVVRRDHSLVVDQRARVVGNPVQRHAAGDAEPGLGGNHHRVRRV